MGCREEINFLNLPPTTYKLQPDKNMKVKSSVKKSALNARRYAGKGICMSSAMPIQDISRDKVNFIKKSRDKIYKI